MLVAAAFVPIPPLLVPEIAGASAPADEQLRAASRNAVRRLLDADLDEVVVIGPAATEGVAAGSWDWRGFGVARPEVAPLQRLPLGPAIGSWLLEQCGATTPYRCYGVTAETDAAACEAIGRELVRDDRRTGLLLCGDGTACRSEKAPGSFDPGAQEWDASALTGLQEANAAALLGLDAVAGRRLLAAGRAPWQVLAGAASDGTFDATIDWADAPYGVMYIVGTWMRREAAGE